MDVNVDSFLDGESGGVDEEALEGSSRQNTDPIGDETKQDISTSLPGENTYEDAVYAAVEEIDLGEAYLLAVQGEEGPEFYGFRHQSSGSPIPDDSVVSGEFRQEVRKRTEYQASD